MNKYRYIKKYPVRFFRGKVDLFLKSFALIFSLSGIFILMNAIVPVISYQLSFSPKFQTEQFLSPLIPGLSKSNFSLYSQVLGNEAEVLDSARNWFPDAPFQLTKDIPVDGYKISIPRLKINDAEVKLNVEDLNKSLIHYPGTGIPGKNGNVVIFGHSALPQFFSPTNYKTIFATLPIVKKNDQILVDYDQVRYTYIIEELTEVSPNNINILEQKFDDGYLTLVTCVPPGTFLRRLIVRARLMKV